MVYPQQNPVAEQTNFKVSFTARLVAAFVYVIPALGAAVSSLYLMNMFRALKENENAGMGVVLSAMTEGTMPVLGALYLGAFGGFVVIVLLIVRAFMQTKTASPSAWFFIFCGFLFLVPAGLFFEAESMIIEVLTMPVDSGGIGAVASNINLFLILSVAATLFVGIVLLALSVIPFKTASKPKWSPLIVALLIEFLIIGAVVLFQLRFLWFYNSALKG